MNYVITTERLGMRNWMASDKVPFIAMGKDPEVMKHFPGLMTESESLDLINRLQQHFEEHGFTYFALDRLDTGEFLGFTGMKHQFWESEYTPCVDLGWRLKRTAWGKGYATEAANACLMQAYQKFGLKELLAFATDTNIPSINVMRKIGMQHIGKVQHPIIEGDPRFKHCEVYKYLTLPN